MPDRSKTIDNLLGRRSVRHAYFVNPLFVNPSVRVEPTSARRSIQQGRFEQTRAVAIQQISIENSQSNGEIQHSLRENIQELVRVVH